MPTPTMSMPRGFVFRGLSFIYAGLTLSPARTISRPNTVANRSEFSKRKPPRAFNNCAASFAVIKIFVRRLRPSARRHADATPRIRSHRSAKLPARGSRSHRQFSFAYHGTRARCGRRRPPHQEPLRLHARAPLAHPHLVFRARESRTRAHQPVRVD